MPASLAVQFEADISKFFAVFDCLPLVVLIDCSEAKMSRSGYILCQLMTTTDNKGDCFIPRACTHGT